MKAVRCAIYTRKSSEDGLEQSFNSLDAQREACAAYILSQASEGWGAIPHSYDDGGISGGTLERPGIQQLLADVAASKIDIVVVYKVDRLTRSLLDFAKLVEAFDAAAVSFVSVTQSFNTTTSMGRLTLNMLLSFAQFEREVTAERIRDKIAASKAKGMWMGGVTPLGYEVDGRTLRIVPDQAAAVRDIYDRYLALGNVRLLAEQLDREQIKVPERTANSGKRLGGGPFQRGQLYNILKSPIYIGEIPHGAKRYCGLHQPIVDRATWDQVQRRLAEQLQGERSGRRSASPSILVGKVFDASGSALIASHACKGAKRYRYYIGQAADGRPPIRIPAAELEGAVGARLSEAFSDPLSLCERAELKLEPSVLGQLEESAAVCVASLRKCERSLLQSLITQVRIFPEEVQVLCDREAVATELGASLADKASGTIEFSIAVRLKRSGRAVRLVQTNGGAANTVPSLPLIRLLLRARRWWGILRTESIGVSALAKREGVTRSYLARVVRLAFLAPDVVDAILAGRLKADVDGATLTATYSMSPTWTEQVEQLLPA